jgi:hypothetical protein
MLNGGALPSDRVVRIGTETTAALDYIHRQGIVHRDVKPSNLMLDAYGSIRLADFGIARLLGATRITGTHQAIGTMAYIAPEQLEGGEVGPPTDVYSLGLVLIECLTGRRVFDGPPAEAAAARMSRDPDVPAALPGGWPGILAAMTARDPHTRPSAAAVRNHLARPASDTRSALATAPIAAALHDADGTATMPDAAARTEAQPAAVAPVRRRRGRRPWAAVLLVGGLVAGAAVAGLLAYNASSEGGSPPATTTTAVPVTTAPPPTLPPTTVPPTTLPPAQPDNRGKGKGGDAEKQIQKWLEELRKRFEEAQQGD